MSSTTDNVLDRIERTLLTAGGREDVRVIVPDHATDADVLLVGRRPGWHERDAGEDTVDAVREELELGRRNVRRRDSKSVGLRLSDRWFEEVGAGLESGVAPGLDTTDLAAGERWLVNYCNPNATKAFHVGHLRNIALGNALACLLLSCGADVTTESHVGDIGRGMGEALAGYFERGECSAVPEDVKSDHYVGECYSSYVNAVSRHNGGAEDAFVDPALSRDDLRYDDAAERLLSRRTDGAVIESAWRLLRDWSVAGHRDTLDRLGIGHGEILFESECADEISLLSKYTVDRCIADRLKSGALAYSTGHSEYPYLLLQRSDGFPTQHLRFLARWRLRSALLGEVSSVEVIGDEWLPLTIYSKKILEQLDPGRVVHPKIFVFHGMVTTDGGLVTSSNGRSLLIDDLLSRLADDDFVAGLAARHGHNRMRLAAVAALGFYLARHTRERIRVSYDAFLDPWHNPGWMTMHAWLCAWKPQYDGAAFLPVEDERYRKLILRCELYRRVVRIGLRDLDTRPVMRFCSDLSRWFLCGPPSPSLARAMRPVLDHGLAALGLYDESGGRGSDAPSEHAGDYLTDTAASDGQR